jgi:hypothetical protein
MCIVATNWTPVVPNSLDYFDPAEPVIIAGDETKCKRVGNRVKRSRWVRDPLSPPFHVNFIKVIRSTVQMVGGAHPTRLRASGWLRYGLHMRPNRRVAPLIELGKCPNPRGGSRTASEGGMKLRHTWVGRISMRIAGLSLAMQFDPVVFLIKTILLIYYIGGRPVGCVVSGLNQMRDIQFYSSML